MGCGGFENLKVLDLSFCHVKDSAMRPLQQLTSLSSLGM